MPRPWFETAAPADTAGASPSLLRLFDDEPAAATPRLAEIAIVVAALAVGFAASPHILPESAAVGVRLAGQLATGHGFSFDGATPALATARPAWVLVLALLGVARLPLENAAIWLSVLAFAATSWCVSRLATGLGGRWWTGALAASLLAFSPPVWSATLDGSGAAFCLALTLASLVAAFERRVPLAAGLAGAACLAGPEALAAALALIVAVRIVEKEWLQRYLLICGSILVAWVLFALLYFGTIVPTAVPAAAPAAPGGATPTAAQLLLSGHRFAVLALAAIFFLYTEPLRKEWRIAGWTIAVAVAILLVTLVLTGGPARVAAALQLYAFAAVLAGAAPGRLDESLERWTRPRVAAASAALAFVVVPGAGALVERFDDRSTWTASDLLQLDRRLAVEYLVRVAGGEGEIEVDTPSAALGWPGRAVLRKDARTDGRRSGPPDYRIASGQSGPAGGTAPEVAPGLVPVFLSELAHRRDPRASWVTVFAAPTTPVARSGRRHLRLYDLPPPEPVSEALGLKDFSRQAADAWAHPPSGAIFRIPNAGRRFALRFQPGFKPDTPADRTDGVTFEVYLDGERVYRSHVTPRQPSARIELRHAPSSSADETELALLTLPGPRDNRDWDWAMWWDFEIVVEGEAAGR